MIWMLIGCLFYALVGPPDGDDRPANSIAEPLQVQTFWHEAQHLYNQFEKREELNTAHEDLKRLSEETRKNNNSAPDKLATARLVYLQFLKGCAAKANQKSDEMISQWNEAAKAALKLRTTPGLTESEALGLERVLDAQSRLLWESKNKSQFQQMLQWRCQTAPALTQVASRSDWLNRNCDAAADLYVKTSQKLAAKSVLKNLETIAGSWFPTTIFPNGHAASAKIDALQGGIANAEKRYADAIRYWKRLLPFRRFELTQLRPDPNAAGLCTLLAIKIVMLEADLQQHDQARQSGRELLELIDQYEMPLYYRIEAVRTYARVLVDQNNLEEAYVLLVDEADRDREIARIGPINNQMFFVALLKDCAMVAHSSQRMIKAVKHGEEALALVHQMGDGHPDKWYFMFRIGSELCLAYSELAWYEKAHRLLVTLKQQSKNAPLKPQHKPIVQWNLLNAETVLAATEGDHLSAVIASRKLLQMYESTPNHGIRRVNVMQTYIQLAHALISLRRQAEAEQALAKLEKVFQDSQQMLNPFEQQVAKRNIRFVRAAHAMTHTNWGTAIGIWEQLIKETRMGSTSDDGIDDRLFEYEMALANCLICVGSYEAAAQLLEKARRIAKSMAAGGFERKYGFGVVLPCQEGHVLMAQGKLKEAALLFQQAAKAERLVFYDIGVRDSTHRALFWLLTAGTTVDYLLSIDREVGMPVAQTYAAVADHRGLVFRMLRQSSADAAALSDREPSEIFDRYSVARQAAANLAFDLALGRRPRNSKSERALAEAEKLCAELERTMKWDSPARPSNAFVDSRRNWQRTVASLGEGEVIVEFIEYVHLRWNPESPGLKGLERQRRYRVFTLSKERGLQQKDLGASDRMDEAIDAWRDAVQSGATIESGRDLRRQLWEPITEILPQKIDRVMISPAGRISLVAWPALPGSKRDRPILEEIEFLTIPYAGWLQDMGKSDVSSKSRRMVAIGGIDYGSKAEKKIAQIRSVKWRESLEHIKELPGAAREIEALRKLADDREFIAIGDNAASSDRVLKAMAGARWIHMATHGVVAPDRYLRGYAVRPAMGANISNKQFGKNPLSLMGLALSGAATQPTAESFLLANRIASQSLSHTELVVLSTCHSGRGPILGNEGAFSMHRAFLLAGARGVVSSVWAVEDQATIALMREFYRCLWSENLPPSRALRKAQLRIATGQVPIVRADFTVRGPNIKKLKPIPDFGVKCLPPRLWAGFFYAGMP